MVRWEIERERDREEWKKERNRDKEQREKEKEGWESEKKWWRNDMLRPRKVATSVTSSKNIRSTENFSFE